MVTSWRAFAHKREGYLWHVGEKQWVELHGLPHPIVEVEVTLDDDGTYYGWHAAGKEASLPQMIWPHETLYSICFPYGPEAEEDAGRGRTVRMKIVEAQSALGSSA